MNSTYRTNSFEISVPVGDLFPLFSPEGEKLWVPGWDYQNVMGTTELSEDYVFLTTTHDHNAKRAIWIVKSFDPDLYSVQFYRVEPEEKVGVVSVVCTELESAKTRVQVTYKYTALSAAGEKFIAEFSAERYAAFIDEWRVLLLARFQSGD